MDNRTAMRNSACPASLCKMLTNPPPCTNFHNQFLPVNRGLFFLILACLAQATPAALHASEGILVAGQPSAVHYFMKEIAEPGGLSPILAPEIPKPEEFSGHAVVVLAEPPSDEAYAWHWNQPGNEEKVRAYVENGGTIFLLGGRMPFSREENSKDREAARLSTIELLGIANSTTAPSSDDLVVAATDQASKWFDGDAWKQGITLARADNPQIVATELDAAHPLLEATHTRSGSVYLGTRQTIGKGSIIWLAISPFRLAHSTDVEISAAADDYKAAVMRLVEDAMRPE